MANDDAPDAAQDVISATCERPVEVESRAGKINHYSTPDTSVTDLENDSTKPSQGVSDEASDPITSTEPVPTAGSVTEDDPAVDDAVPNEVTGEDQEPRAPSPSLSSSSTSTTRPSDQYRRYQNTMKEWGADDPGESVVTGLVDYIRTVEERLSTIENTLRKDGTMEDNEDNSDAASSTGSEPDLPEAIEIKPGIKFMEAKSSDFYNNGVIFDNVGAHSGFSSVLDDAHMLRVLYNKSSKCVAAYTKRPLYPITCGDIGHSPEIVEQNLEKHFKLAHRWACVLLLDEADVFLAKRTKTDVKRNGLVSVFLRILEYYPGILFLTTNRVGAIDDAFRSRLHLTLYYPKLKKKQTTKIWTNNINKMHDINEHRMKRGQPPIEYDENKIIKWAKSNQDELQWNGRQIRNAFQTAIALAEFQAQPRRSRKAAGGSSSTPKAPKPPVLDQNIFTKIANASIQFTEYLHETHGQDEDAMASRDQVRSSSYKKGKHKIKTVVESSESSSDSDDSSGSSHHSDSSDSESDTESDSSAPSETSESEAKADRKKKKAKSSKKTKEKDEKKGRKEKKGLEKTEKTKKKKKSEA
ncbi:hypothetical protein C8034_v000414 [Colletotrichum sidae]|uniref:Uncharacterized protein n=1 Tax=Colletotrichum sidae TaxID=1347389 RepID=A0A4R8TG77_9PEZI|nr:hypothetical protein C8034_v000414 [Colletotrichum sidae]